MQRRGKVGGILDRRFGENDPTMTPEQRALERFVREKQRGNRKGGVFDLEDAGEENHLTHSGQLLSFDNPKQIDDFKEPQVEVFDGSMPEEEEEEEEEQISRPAKRQRLSQEDSIDEISFGASNEKPTDRMETRKEVMNEVISKAKLHKYERQQAKEDDDDLRAELDKGLPDLFAMLRGNPRPGVPAHAPDSNGLMNPDRAAMISGKGKSQADLDYDERLRQMVFDQRSKPTERTLTEEEKLHLQAQKLKELEEKRLQRMNGERDENSGEDGEREEDLRGDKDLVSDDDDDRFGLGSGIPNPGQAREIGVEDEDDFFIEDNLVGSGSEFATDDESSEHSRGNSSDEYDDQEFVQDLLSADDIGRLELTHTNQANSSSVKDNALAYTYPCPQNHEDLLLVTENISLEDLPTVVQRMRALYHPKLHSENKAKLATFSAVLVDHVFYLANLPRHPSFKILEILIRHIHSLAKSFPEEVGGAFREHLKSFHKNRPTAPTSGDLVLLTAIASIFPTSDHFHQVVTPANLCMTRYLSQKIPSSLGDLATGAYVGTLCLQYQKLSKRYTPELVNYILQALLNLAPAKMKVISGPFPYHVSEPPLQIEGRLRKVDREIRRLGFWDSIDTSDTSDDSNEEFKIALVHALLALVKAMADMWAERSAFLEVFEPVSAVLEHLLSKSCSGKLPAATKVRILFSPSIPTPALTIVLLRSSLPKPFTQCKPFCNPPVWPDGL